MRWQFGHERQGRSGSRAAAGAFSWRQGLRIWSISGSVRRVFGEWQGDEKFGLDEEGVQRKLEVGDGTVGVWEGGLEMGEDVCRRPVLRLSRQRGGQLGRRTACGECRADLALAKSEAFPDALQGAVSEVAVGSADSGEDAAGGGELEEAPQAAGGQAEPSDFVGAPDAEGPTATRASVAVAAKDPACANGLALGRALVKAAQIAVAIERAVRSAMGTGRLLESLGKSAPFLVAAAKPLHVGHLDWTFPKRVILRMWGRGGVEAGYDKKSLSEVRGCEARGAGVRGAGRGGARCGARGKIPGRPLPNCRCNKHPAIG